MIIFWSDSMACYGFCQQCKMRFTKKRNPTQKYCSSNVCQQTRKNVWRRSKMQNDTDYKNNQKMANKRWRSLNTDYWKRYRSSHPDYVKRNQEAQRARDGAALLHASPLAKRDAFIEQTQMAPGTYWLSTEKPNLAKRDAFLVKISFVSNGYMNFSNLANSPPYSQSD